MNIQELMEKMKKEVGFTISPLVFPAYGTQVYAGKSVIFDLDGNLLREATETDINKWNTAWRQVTLHSPTRIRFEIDSTWRVE